MYTEIYTSSIEQTYIAGPVNDNTAFVVAIGMTPVTTGLLSTVTLTARWNDGLQNRSKILVLPLSVLTGLASEVFTAYIAEGEAMTMESTLVGSGTYRVAWTFI